MAVEGATPLLSRDPRSLGNYQLLGRLGEGGMGTVFLGRSPAGVLVAVKVVRPELAPGDEFRRRFRSEVARARQVPPFCTAEVLDADPDHEQPYLVVEYVDGPSLARVVDERGPLTPANLHSVAIGVATALTAIHGAGVIHRDLKPANVLLAPGSPKVIDFGIARATEATSDNTRAGQMLGTVAYMAPERFGSEADTPLTPAADVFAWGGVVAYAGTGRTPFGGDSPPVTAARILTQPPDLRGLTGPLRDLVAQSLHKDPGARPSARDLLDVLVAGPSWPAATAAALADQPALRAAAAEAQAATGHVSPAQPVDAFGAGESTEDTVANNGVRAHTVVIAPRSAAPTSAVATSAVPAAAVTATSPGSAPRRRRLLPAGIALLALAAIGAAMVLVLGLPPRYPTEAQVDSFRAPSTDSNQDLLISDTLTRPGYWLAKSEPDGKSSCSFEGALVVRTENVVYKCPGPQDVEPDDVGVDVAVQLITPGSCASMWLRFRPQQGYQVQICDAKILVGTHKGRSVTIYRTFPLTEPIGIRSTTHIGLRAVGSSVQVLRDGVALGAAPLTDPDIAGGRVLLGVFTDRDVAPVGPVTVSFADIRITGLHR